MSENNFNRRDFLRGATLGAFGLGFGLEEITAEAQNKKPATKATQKPAAKANGAKLAPAPDDERLEGQPVSVAVIGLGSRGREILTSLARIGPNAPVLHTCDSYSDPRFVKKAQEIAPKAAFTADYKKVLDDKNVKAVFIATPTHKHKQIALDALQAGKHVYLEAPLSNDIAEAKAIAQAAKGANSQVFVAGLQQRCNLQSIHVGRFVQTRQIGNLISATAQHHDRDRWKTAWPNPQREAELNWRLDKSISSGVMGEIGIHQIDLVSWFNRALPVSVTGFSAVKWDDERQVPDTVQAIIEYPKNVRLVYDLTLRGSLLGSFETFSGTEAAIVLRDQRAWMFKEPESGQLGWEVFARKDQWTVGNVKAGTGLDLGSAIALVANATKQLALGREPGKVGTDVTKTALFQAVKTFLRSVQAGQRISAKEPNPEHPNPPLPAGPEEGYTATVVAIKANEAVLSGNRVVFEKEWFAL